MISYREVDVKDGGAIASLFERSHDTGRIGVRPLFIDDPGQFYREVVSQENMFGFVAEAETLIVGTCFARVGVCHFNGEERRFAYLHSLAVAPEYRRRSIGTELVRYCIEKAVALNYPLHFANVQVGNTASNHIIQKRMPFAAGHIYNSFVKVSNDPSLLREKEVTVRPATRQDWQEIIQQANIFYQNFNFYCKLTEDSMKRWETPFLGMNCRKYLVAVDKKSRKIIAGLGVTESFRFQQFQFVLDQAPLPLLWLNRFIKLVPPDGTMKQINIEEMWFTPGNLEKARFLWDSVRQQWHDKANSVMFRFDPNSSLARVINLPFWVPKGKTMLFVSDKPDRRLISSSQ